MKKNTFSVLFGLAIMIAIYKYSTETINSVFEVIKYFSKYFIEAFTH